uniref:Uncharacterized protein n=1 Tax=Syphacia muris TaxID=451379 RepID=A0A0N5AQM8_9BILA
MHYGCATKTVMREKRCAICKEPYKYFRYGTIFHYIWRYPCRTTLPFLFYIAVLCCMAYKLFGANIPNARFIEYIVLLRWELTIFLFASLILVPWITYTCIIGRREFVRKRGQVIVFDRFTMKRLRDNYGTCCNQTSINTPIDFEKEKCLAASTPLPDTSTSGEDLKHFLLP